MKRRRSGRAGFIFLFGSRSIVTNGHEPPVQTRCPRCGQEVEMVAKQYRHWFTLFFIPIFPISKATPFCQCSKCQAHFQIPAGELRGRVAATDENQAREAIALYNSLRSSPLNSVALNQLMTMYATMKEYDQAASAARDFPQALQASEQCMSTLGRVYLGMNRHDEALRWFDEATARNPQLGEAQYYKALTHLLTEAPQFERAIAAARAARSAGYPNADALLRDAETRARAAEK